jgi:hypothetical protein
VIRSCHKLGVQHVIWHFGDGVVSCDCKHVYMYCMYAYMHVNHISKWVYACMSSQLTDLFQSEPWILAWNYILWRWYCQLWLHVCMRVCMYLSLYEWTRSYIHTSTYSGAWSTLESCSTQPMHVCMHTIHAYIYTCMRTHI